MIRNRILTQLHTLSANQQTQSRLLRLSRIRLEASLQSMSTNYFVVLQLGNVMRVMASKVSDPSEKEDCWNKAITAYETVTRERAEQNLHCQAHTM